MEKEYPVYREGTEVGKAFVDQEGLYWHIRCRCRLDRSTMYRLMLSSRENTRSLGILAPSGDYFTLRSRVPVKQFSMEDAAFKIAPKNVSEGRRFVPICPEEPFAYLDRIKNGILSEQDGETGMLFKDSEI